MKETTDPTDRKKIPTYLWSTRHDVWINYLGKHGDLTVGYGAPREGFGPEYNFGHVMGNHYDEQVLLIKASWGGRALARGFLPPSSMLSDAEYAKQAAAQNAANQAWNDAEPARVAAHNKRVAEQNRALTLQSGPVDDGHAGRGGAIRQRQLGGDLVVHRQGEARLLDDNFFHRVIGTDVRIRIWRSFFNRGSVVIAVMT